MKIDVIFNLQYTMNILGGSPEKYVFFNMPILRKPSYMISTWLKVFEVLIVVFQFST